MPLRHGELGHRLKDRGLRLIGRRLLADLDWAAWREGNGVALQHMLNPQPPSIEGIRKDQQG